MNIDKIQKIETKNLVFDPMNPRFFRIAVPNPAHGSISVDIVDEMIERESIQELMASIGEQGYFDGEPLLVVPTSGGKYVVVEGNRRLAATKLLNKELKPTDRRTASVASLIEEATKPAPRELPCLIYKDRKEILKYLGYRHITGTEEWDSLSKARYLLQLRDQFYSSLPSAEEQHKRLAKDIGSKAHYVGLLLTALNLYNKAEESIFKKIDLKSSDVMFSFITTALGYDKIWSWLGLKSKTDTEMSDLKMENLSLLFAWMFKKDQQGYTILGESRKIGELAAVVACSDAIDILKETRRLSEAFLYSDGPEEVLDNAFKEVMTHINTVWKMLPKINLSNRHLENAESIFNIAKDVRSMVKNKLEEI